MKRTLISLVMALTFAAASFITVFTSVLNGSEAVEIKKCCSYGDDSYLNGLNYEDEYLMLDGCLRWKVQTDFTGNTVSHFKFSKRRNFEYGGDPRYFDLSLINLGISGSKPGYEGDSQFVKDIRTFCNEAVTESEKDFYFKDYFDSYPLSLTLNSDELKFYINGISCTDELIYVEPYEKLDEVKNIYKVVSDYFRFPIPDNAFLRCKITPSTYRNQMPSFSSEAYGIDGNNFSYAKKNDNLYFCITPNPSPDDGTFKPLDFSYVKGGCGIYSCPLNGDVPDFTQIKNVYPLQMPISYMSVLDAPNSRFIYLFTYEKDGSFLNIFDTESSEILQKINISPDFYYGFGKTGDDYIIIFPDGENHEFVLYQRDEKNFYSEKMRHSDSSVYIPDKNKFFMTDKGQVKNSEEKYNMDTYINTKSITTYNDGLLYVLTDMDDYTSCGVDYIVSVFSPEKMLSIASYRNSLSDYNNQQLWLSDIVSERKLYLK